MKKRIFVLSLLLVFIITALCAQYVGALSYKNDSDMQRQGQSVDEYRKILNAVGSENEELVQSDFSKENLACVYAGAYINENQLLVINVTNATDGIKEEIKSISENPDIIINEVNYSLSEIDEAYERLVGDMENAPYFKVTASEKNNTVYITGESARECERYILENGYNPKMITVVEGQNTVEDCASAYAGSNIVCTNNNKSGTVGFACKKNSCGEKGVVTASHVVCDGAGNNTLGNTVKIDGNSFGKVVSSRYGNSVDAAFIEKSSSLLPVWVLRGNLINKEKINGWGNASYTPEGTTIRHFGSTSRHLSSAVSGAIYGQVVSNKASITVGNYKFYSLTETTAYMQSGDSGGPCIVTDSNDNTILVGIIKGHDTEIQHTYYCRLDKVMSELGVTPIVNS